jgi:hypothetical protein
VGLGWLHFFLVSNPETMMAKDEISNKITTMTCFAEMHGGQLSSTGKHGSQ